MVVEISSLTSSVFFILSILLLLLLAIGSLVILAYYVILDTFFNKDEEDNFDKTLKKYGSWSANAIHSRLKLIKKIVIAEFFIAFSILIYFIYTNRIILNPEIFQFQKIASSFYENNSFTLNCLTDSCLLSSSTSLSLEKISIVIGILGVIVIYVHFFEMLGDDRNLKKFEESQAKYFSFFKNLWVFTGLYTLFVIILYIIKNDPNIIYQMPPLVIGWINVYYLIPLPFYFRKNFENFQSIEKFNEDRKVDKSDSISSYVFILTLLIAYMGYCLNYDIFLLIFLEITLLLMYFWTKRFEKLPIAKYTIRFNVEANNPSSSNYYHTLFLKDVYIIEENEENILVITENGTNKIKIMKSAIREIVIPHPNE
jgi:hypothetical protein